MTDVSEEYARRTGESTEGMTPLQRAEALEVEAAQLIDKVTGRGYWSGEPSREATRLVDLLMEAAIGRLSSTAQALLDSAAMQSRPAFLTDGKTIKPALTCGAAHLCALPLGHEGNCKGAETEDECRARAADRVEFNVGVHKATDG